MSKVTDRPGLSTFLVVGLVMIAHALGIVEESILALLILIFWELP